MEKIDYQKLKAKQKEIYNFQRVSGLLAEYGFTTIKLSDDWEGADFLAIPFDHPEKILRVQLKSRLTFDKKYEGKNLQICFEDKKTGCWYLYGHDDLFSKLSKRKNFANTSSWVDGDKYTFNTLSKEDIEDLKECVL
jgi:hypothetical protein